MPDESDFGQLLHINSHEATEPAVSNPLGPNDKSLGQTTFNSNGYPPPPPFEGINQAQNSDLHEINNYHAAHTLPSSISTKSPYQINPIQHSTYQQHTQADLTNRKDPTGLNTDGTKKDADRHGKFEGFSVMDSLSDSYDAMSTEATPSQTRINNSPPIQSRVQSSHQQPGQANNKKSPNSRGKNRANSTNSFDSNNPDTNHNHLTTMDTVDLNFDDMQTTRSSIGNHHQLNHDIGLSSPQADHQLVTLSAVPNHQATNSKPLDDSDELVTSAFSRSSGNGSSNNNNTSQLDAQLNSAMMTNLFSSMHYPRSLGAESNQLDSPDSQLSPSVNSNPNSNQFHSAGRGFAGSMPLSVLLNDLIKMSKPYQPISNGDQNPRDRNPQQQNHGILQQLKSLPSPFLSLLQSLSPSSIANSVVGSHGHGLTPSMTNNDASESNQYYQKISFLPSDFGSFLSRSMRSITAPLPAFPAPKGYVERAWNEAENPEQYQADQSVNADFVANNAAGFVRFLPNSNQQQLQQQSSSPAAYQPKNPQPTDNVTPSSGSNLLDQQQQAKAPISHQSWSQSGANSESTGHDNYNNNRQVASVGNQQGSQLAGGQQSLGINGASQPMTYQAGINYYQRAMNPNPNPNLGQLQTSPQQQHFINHPSASQINTRNQFGQAETSPIINQQNTHVYNVAQPNLINLQQHHQQQQQQQRQQVNMMQPNMMAKARSARKKRSMWRIVDNVDEISERIDPLPDEELDPDSPPMSIVSPDGRPMDSVRVARFPAQSAFVDNHRNHMSSLSQEESSLHDDNDSKISRAHHRQLSASKRKRPESNRHPFELDFIGLAGRDDEQVLSRLNNHRQMSPNEMSSLASQQRANDRLSMGGPMETASSGLMGKLLLGKASTIDEMDDDLKDDDDESPSEKRKEELEDAEFGIVNPKSRPAIKRKNRKRTAASQRSRSATRSAKKRESQKKPNSQTNKLDDSNKNSVESTGISSDTGLYAKKNQQRSDIEFYGHPGEETRQLKYGILGSGNYEVYNGGVYAETDELASAVNSVANYARKPSNALALKLLGAEPLRLNHIASAGSRLNGLMRGASMLGAAEGEQAGLLGGLMPNDLTASDKSGLAGNPLLDLIYPASPGNSGNHLLDSSLMSQLGSNTRSVHTDHQQDKLESNDLIGSVEREPSTKPESFGNSKTDDNRVDINEDELLSHSNRKQRRKGSKPVDSNQFNSYVISPSKKVNIFSDTDLDSAPSDQNETIDMDRATRIRNHALGA